MAVPDPILLTDIHDGLEGVRVYRILNLLFFFSFFKHLMLTLNTWKSHYGSFSVELNAQQLSIHHSVSSKMPRRENLKMGQEMTKVSSVVCKLADFCYESLL